MKLILLTNDNKQKINIAFINSGKLILITARYGTTVEQLIKMYLYKVGGKELIDDYYSQKKIKFIFDCKIIEFKEQKFVENYFRGTNADVQVFD